MFLMYFKITKWKKLDFKTEKRGCSFEIQILNARDCALNGSEFFLASLAFLLGFPEL
jgi:hypothetical protein